MATPLLEILVRARGVVSQIRASQSANFGFPIQVRRDVEPVILSMVRESIGREYPVQMEYSAVPVGAIRGKLIRYENSGTIIISSEQTMCWRRFVLCKELAHLIIDDEPESRTTDIELHIQGMNSDARNFVWNSAIDSEYEAIIMAAEIMVPWIDRASFNRMLKDGHTSRDVAERYKVPERIIDMMRGDYLGMSAKHNALLDGQGRFEAMN